jgi:mannose-6-phosphate isomerase-like protein (cupin superfamily)
MASTSSQPVVHGPGAGETIRIGGSTVTIKAGGEQTGETFFLAETTIEAGFAGPPPHVHERLHDAFYVLEGTLTVRLGDREVEAGPGTFVCVPPGTAHAFANRTGAPVRFLNVNTPAGWERYMRDLGRELAGPEPPTAAAIGRIAARYDFRPVS